MNGLRYYGLKGVGIHCEIKIEIRSTLHTEPSLLSPQTETVLGPARDVATANAADIERAGGTWEARGLDWVYVLKYVSETMRYAYDRDSDI